MIVIDFENQEYVEAIKKLVNQLIEQKIPTIVVIEKTHVKLINREDTLIVATKDVEVKKMKIKNEGE